MVGLECLIPRTFEFHLLDFELKWISIYMLTLIPRDYYLNDAELLCLWVSVFGFLSIFLT